MTNEMPARMEKEKLKKRKKKILATDKFDVTVLACVRARGVVTAV